MSIYTDDVTLRTKKSQPSAEALPEAELEVLSVLHRVKEADAVEVGQALRHLRPLSHSSVVTLLRRLEARGLVSRRRADRGKAFLYSPVQSAIMTYSSVIGRMLRRVFDQDSLSLVTSLFEAKPPTKSEVRELRELLDRLEEKRGAR